VEPYGGTRDRVLIVVTIGKTFTVVASAAVLLGVLAGCSGGSTQTKAAGCTKLLAAVETATTNLNTAISSYTSDPTSSAKAITKVSGAFHTDVKNVSNNEVKKVSYGADTAIGKLSAAITKSAKTPSTPDAKALTTASTAVSAAFVDIRKTCE
jgi:hypothetical protein